MNNRAMATFSDSFSCSVCQIDVAYTAIKLNCMTEVCLVIRRHAVDDNVQLDPWQMLLVDVSVLLSMSRVLCGSKKHRVY